MIVRMIETVCATIVALYPVFHLLDSMWRWSIRNSEQTSAVRANVVGSIWCEQVWSCQIALMLHSIDGRTGVIVSDLL